MPIEGGGGFLTAHFDNGVWGGGGYQTIFIREGGYRRNLKREGGGYRRNLNKEEGGWLTNLNGGVLNKFEWGGGGGYRRHLNREGGGVPNKFK